MKPIPRVLRLTAAVLTGTAVCLSMAADTPMESFKKLRGDWKLAVLEKTKALRESYGRRLKVLETGFIERGDYAAAARARKERLKISGEGPAPEISYGSLPGPQEEDQPVMLEISRARLTGGATLNAETSTLGGWVAGASASWQLPANMESAGYTVELTYATAPDAGGILNLKEDFYTLQRDIAPTAGWEDFQTKNIGTLRMSAGSHALEFSAGSVKGSGLMQLRGVRLLPPAESK